MGSSESKKKQENSISRPEINQFWKIWKKQRYHPYPYPNTKQNNLTVNDKLDNKKFEANQIDECHVCLDYYTDFNP
jgi:hypothetical protein